MWFRSKSVRQLPNRANVVAPMHGAPSALIGGASLDADGAHLHQALLDHISRSSRPGVADPFLFALYHSEQPGGEEDAAWP